MRKKFFMVLICVMLAFTLAGCGNADEPASADNGSSEDQVNNQSDLGAPAGDVITIATAGGYQIPESDLTYMAGDESGSAVYYSAAISSDALTAIYEALGRMPVEGERVAVKLHTGEGEGSYNLEPELIKELVQSVDGTIVECNTAYGGSRASTALHMQIAEDHGYTAIAQVDIMDADGSLEIPVTGGTHLDSNMVEPICRIMIFAWCFPTSRDIPWAVSEGL